MTRRGRWAKRLLTLAACLAVVVAGCGADVGEPTEQGLTRVRVALFPGGSTLPAHVAITKGICERNGLRIELTEGTDLPVFMAALAKGQYDIAMSVPTLALVGAEKHLTFGLSRVCSDSHASDQMLCGSPRMRRSRLSPSSRARRSRCRHSPESLPTRWCTCWSALE